MRLAGTSPLLRVRTAIAKANLPQPLTADPASGAWIWKGGGIMQNPNDTALFHCILIWSDGSQADLDLRIPDDVMDFEGFLDNLQEATA